MRRIFKRWTLIDKGRIFLAISTRFPPRWNLWFWRHKDKRFYDLRIWPVDFLWRKWARDWK
jgi:hypothetical protein